MRLHRRICGLDHLLEPRLRHNRLIEYPAGRRILDHHIDFARLCNSGALWIGSKRSS